MLSGNLGKQQSASSPGANQETVAAKLNLFGAHRHHGRKNRYLDSDFGKLFGTKRREPVVFGCRENGAASDGVSERTACLGLADAAAQPPTAAKSDKRTAMFGERSAGGSKIKMARFGNCGLDRGSCNRKQLLALFVREKGHPAFFLRLPSTEGGGAA